jgi:ankyrin repeat protein
MVQLLLRKGADPSLKDSQSNTPLHYAVKRNDIEVVRSLLQYNADVDAQNMTLETPMDFAWRYNSSLSIVELLQEHRNLVEGPMKECRQVENPRPNAPTSQACQKACRAFQVTVTEIYSHNDTTKHWSYQVSVHDLIYGSEELETILEGERPEAASDKVICKWLHIPENNVSLLPECLSTC